MNSIEWRGDSVRFIDQTKLPAEEVYTTTDDYTRIAEAIRALGIRGAPLIGVAAAYGVALASLKSGEKSIESFRIHLKHVSDTLRSTRPTAVNLFWALERMDRVIASAGSVADARDSLVREAIRIHDDDRDRCRRISLHGLEVLPPNASVLTYCNAGALATGGEGTALGIVTEGFRKGRVSHVYACETRPALQGSRLTAWELRRAGIDVTLIADNTAAVVMREKKVHLVLVGADRIAANGDTANKVGTYSLAVAAHRHKIPLYVAAPRSTVDPSLASGEKIPIELRSGKELTDVGGKRFAPADVSTYTPAFDVTPSELISAIITEDGVRFPPYDFRTGGRESRSRRT